MVSPDATSPLDVMHTVHLTHSPQDYDRTRISVDRSLRLSFRTSRIEEDGNEGDESDEDDDVEEEPRGIHRTDSSGWMTFGILDTGSALDGF